MGIFQRVKRLVTEGSTTITHSITMCQCGECGTIFESQTTPEDAHCPDCESPNVAAVESSLTD
ncbi:MAG: hypothetical protein ABEI86_06135 [Halobacteriaceae archaeon]